MYYCKDIHASYSEQTGCTSNCIIGHAANMIGNGGVTYKQMP